MDAHSIIATSRGLVSETRYLLKLCQECYGATIEVKESIILILAGLSFSLNWLGNTLGQLPKTPVITRDSDLHEMLLQAGEDLATVSKNLSARIETSLKAPSRISSIEPLLSKEDIEKVHLLLSKHIEAIEKLIRLVESDTARADIELAADNKPVQSGTNRKQLVVILKYPKRNSRVIQCILKLRASPVGEIGRKDTREIIGSSFGFLGSAVESEDIDLNHLDLSIREYNEGSEKKSFNATIVTHTSSEIDDVSSAASGQAVVIPALQLQFGFIKLYNRWGTFRDAPYAVTEIMLDLAFLRRTLDKFIDQNDPNHHMQELLVDCVAKVEVLLSIAREFEPDFSYSNRRSRSWNTFKLAQKGKRLKRFRGFLQETKTALLLAVMPEFQFPESYLNAIQEQDQNTEGEIKSFPGPSLGHEPPPYLNTSVPPNAIEDGLGPPILSQDTCEGDGKFTTAGEEVSDSTARTTAPNSLFNEGMLVDDRAIKTTDLSYPIRIANQAYSQQPSFSSVWAALPPSSVVQDVLKVLKAPLNDLAIRNATLMVWAHPEEPRMLKIYVTQKSVSERLEQFKENCGYEPQLICQENIAEAYVIQKLIHAEFEECQRLELRCTGCQESHAHWFEVDPHLIIEAIKRWRRWIKFQPLWIKAIPEAPRMETKGEFREWLDMKIALDGDKLLLSSANSGHDSKTLLFNAAESGNVNLTKSLLETGDVVNYRVPISGATPLHAAAASGHQDVIPVLIAAGADVDSRNIHDQSPLHIAALAGHREVVRILLQHARELDVTISEEVMILVQELMSPISHTNEQPDKDFDLQSVASVSTFNDSGFFSGSQVSQALMVAAKEQLLQIFTTDRDLQALYEEVVRKINREKFIRNFKRLMRSYCVELKPQGNQQEKEIVFFIGRQAIWFADRIYREFGPVDVLRSRAMDSLVKQTPDKVLQLDNYLGQHIGEPPSDQDRDDISAASDSDASFGSGDMDDSELTNINVVRDFLVSGTPFQNLKKNFRQFVHQDRIKESDRVKEAFERPGDFNVASGMNLSCSKNYRASCQLLLKHVRGLFRQRIPQGYKRIEWICGCGELMYADVKELYPGAAQTLQDTLRLSAAAVSEAASNQNDITPPVPTHSLSASTERGSWSNPGPPIRPLDTNIAKTPAADLALDSKTETMNAEPFKRYLLLCINTSKKVHLEQIEVTYTGDDQILFQGIRQAYYNARKAESPGYFATLPSFLGSLFGEISFSRPKNANFVRFELVPMKATLHAAVLDFPTLPPEEEVKIKKSYHYVPCPKDIENPLLQVQFLHEYFKPGRHLGNFWLNRLPKKLKEKLFLNTNGLAIGWGIHIVEEPNWFAYGLVAIAVVALSGVLSLVYSICARDVSGGFGIGAYMVAAQAVTLTTLFLKWQQA